MPQSDLPGEKTHPTQPFPTNPPAFARQGISRDDLTDISPEARAYVREQLKDFRFGPMFTPPGAKETIVLPGFHGGALWGGASFDPDTEWLYVNHNEIPWSTSLLDAIDTSRRQFHADRQALAMKDLYRQGRFVRSAAPRCRRSRRRPAAPPRARR